MDETQLGQYFIRRRETAPHFLGVFNVNQIPPLPFHKSSFAVFFIGNIEKIGHYVAVIFSPPRLLFFDSLSSRVPVFIGDLARDFRLNIVNYSYPFQLSDSCSCSQFAIYFIYLYFIYGEGFCSSRLRFLKTLSSRQVENLVVSRVASMSHFSPPVFLKNC